MKVSIVLFSACILLISCSDTDTKKQVKDTTKNSLVENISTPPKISDIAEGDTFKQGMISVDNTKFRYFIVDDKCSIDKLENERWVNNLNFDYSNRTDTIFLDVNNDGYIDVINSWKWYSQAFLYNSKKKSFETKDIGLSGFWTLIDSSKNIYCDESNVKGKEESSTLYTFENLTKKILYSVSFSTSEIPSEDFPVITKITLYKGDFEDKDSKQLSTTYVEKDYEFDCVKFWSSKYKVLLGYR